MDAHTAAELIRFLERHEIEVYVDGGWAVDALIGEQTRAHEDLDIAVPHAQVTKLRELLGARGFSERPRDDTWECNFVLADEHGSRDEAGRNIFGVPYVREHLAGRGIIDRHPVRCIAPEWLVKFHTGYPLDENDFHDVRLLCERFGIELPEEYL